MKSRNIRWSLLFLMFLFLGCAGSRPAGEEQPAAALPSAQGTEESQQTASALEHQQDGPLSELLESPEDAKKDYGEENSGAGREERLSGSSVYATARGAENSAEIEAGEIDDEELAGIEIDGMEFHGIGSVVEHPFSATKTAKTSKPALLSSEYDGHEPMFHTYTATGTATVSDTQASVSGTPALQAGTQLDSTATPSASAPADAFTLNGDDLDLHEVINLVGLQLGYNYVVDPRVTGKVNIRCNQKIPREDLFSVFETLLRINNATIIRKGDLYHVIPLATTKQEPLTPYQIPGADIPENDTFLMQIVVLNYISADGMATILKPFITTPGAEITPKDTVLIILDFASNIKKLMSLIDLFDVDIFQRLNVQLYEAKYANVEELAAELDEVFQAFELPADTARAGGVTFVPIVRLNMLMAVSANKLLLEKAVQWIERMDTEVSETTLRIFVYYVQNSKALEINDVLMQVFTGQVPQQETAFKSKLRETTPPTGQVPEKKPPTPIRSPKARQTGEEVTGAVEFVVDERNNALIVKCSERDYRTILKTIRKLDIYPKQVLIEVLIAEIRLDDELEMGIEWKYMEKNGENYDYEISSSGAPGGYGKLGEEIVSGLAVNLIKTDRLVADLKAYAAEDRVNILSSPHIIASDNKEATINVTEEIPISSGTVTTSSAEPLITETIQYRDTGIILTVTPHINDKGLVSLEVNQEVSQQSERTATGTDNPIFLKRSAVTTMVVQDGQTVIIGGLIREQWSDGRAGIPYLCEIPVLGYLFGFDRKIRNRSELMFLLTPHVITSIEEADSITKEFKSKLSILQEKEGLAASVKQ